MRAQSPIRPNRYRPVLEVGEAFAHALGLVRSVESPAPFIHDRFASPPSLISRPIPNSHVLTQGPALAETGNRQLPVRIEKVDVVEFPKRLELEPCSPDDWELVELHAGYLEDELLRQVRARVLI